MGPEAIPIGSFIDKLSNRAALQFKKICIDMVIILNIIMLKKLWMTRIERFLCLTIWRDEKCNDIDILGWAGS